MLPLHLTEAPKRAKPLGRERCSGRADVFCQDRERWTCKLGGRWANGSARASLTVTGKGRIRHGFLESALVVREPRPPNMLGTLIISVAEQVKRRRQVTLQALAYSLLAVEILLP